MAQIFTDANFQIEVIEKSQQTPVLVDFWAPWCGPCQIQGPVIEQLAEDMEGKAIIGKLNVDENQQAAVKFNVQGIPTMIVFKNGQPIETVVNLHSLDSLKSILQKYI